MARAAAPHAASIPMYVSRLLTCMEPAGPPGSRLVDTLFIRWAMGSGGEGPARCALRAGERPAVGSDGPLGTWPSDRPGNHKAQHGIPSPIQSDRWLSPFVPQAGPGNAES